MGEIHFQVDKKLTEVEEIIAAIETVATKHDGSLTVGHLSENGRKFTIHAPDEKLEPIQAELEVQKLPRGFAWTSAQLAEMCFA